MTALPLAGLKVLDLSRLLPGPYASLVLADLGATVDKVEDPEGGDYLRNMPPFLGDESALFYALNRNKRSVCLNLKSDEGRTAMKRLVPHYDVLLESFRPGVMARLGLDYENLRKENPRLIYCSITGYGQNGPDSQKAGHDLNYLAKAGVLSHGGSEAHGPAMPGGQFADIGGSLFGLVGILAALHERQRTGQGRCVDIALSEGALAFMHMELGAQLAAGSAATPLRREKGTLNGGLPGYGIYKTQDGRFLSVASLEPKFMVRLCEAIGHAEWFDDAYDTGEKGLRLREALARAFAEHPLSHWQRVFDALDVCVEPVSDPEEVVKDAQFQARGMFVSCFDEKRQMETLQLRVPLHFSNMPFRSPPQLGENGEEILKEAGFSEAEKSSLLSTRK